MPITAGWDDQQQSIMLLSVVEPWTLEEYAEAAQRALEMVSSVSHRVDIIADIRHIGTGFSPIQMLRQVRDVWNNTPTNVRLIVRVGLKMPLEPTVLLFNLRSHHAELIVVDTIDKAYAAIADHRHKSGDAP